MGYYPPSSEVGCTQILAKKVEVDTTTTSVSYVNLLTISIGTSGNSYLFVQVSYAVSDSISLSSGDFLRLTIDGVVFGYAGNETFTCIQSGAMIAETSTLNEGNHVVNLDWHTSGTGNTLRCRPVTQAEHASLIAFEVTV